MSLDEIRDVVQASVFLPGGVADAAGRIGYVTNPAAGVDAIDLETGRRLWRSNEACLGIVAVDGALVAGSRTNGRIHVVVLDPRRNGERLFRSEPIHDSSAKWIVTAARLERGSLLVAWQGYNEFRGARPQGPLQGVTTLGEGAARVDLQTGRVEYVDVERVAGLPPGPPAGIEMLQTLPDASGLLQYWSAGSRIAAVAFEPTGQSTRLLLHTWDRSDGVPFPPVELFPNVPAAGYLRNHRSPDDTHLFLVRCNDREEDGRPPGGNCQVWVFEVTSGRRVAVLPLEPGIEPTFALIGPRFFLIRLGGIRKPDYVQARFLRAVLAATAQTLWEHEIIGRAGPSPAS